MKKETESTHVNYKWIKLIGQFISFVLLVPLFCMGWMIPSHANNTDPTTWTAVDGLGRTLPTNSQTGNVRKNKYVGMFYWSWHSYFSSWEAMNISDIVAQYPEAANDFNHPAWKGRASGVPYFWNEPLFGYYQSKDPYVLRKHAELLADAGVDVIFFDCTNDTLLFLDAVTALCKIWMEAIEQGVNVPKISFMLNISPIVMMENNKVELKQLYRQIYKLEKYKDLWFYWEGKPLVLSTDACLDATDSVEAEILDFFTFRRSDDSFFTDDTKYEDKMWGWLSVYPQTKYGVRSDGTVEQMAVSVAQNANEFGMYVAPGKKYGLTAMNDPMGGVHGRSFVEGEYSYKYNGEKIIVDKNIENSMFYGLNFQQQWDRAIEVDPDIVFITGWNEWIAGRWERWGYSENGWRGVENAFPDQYTDEYSRDLEPSNGPLKDYYYYQLVSNIRRYKGTNSIPIQSEKHTIDISGDLSQWLEVSYEYGHYTGSTTARNYKGYGNLRFESDTMRNDFVKSKVTYDDENIYFLVETVNDITPENDNAWMRLFLDTIPASKNSMNWEGFEYVVNRTSPNANKAILEKSTGGWNWEKVGEVSYKVQANTLQLSIPKAMIGMSEDKINFNFKWSDNMQLDGDVMDFYKSGDVAPGGRFMYNFRNTAVEENDIDVDSENKKTTIPWYGFLCICATAFVVAVAGVGSVIIRKRKNKK